MIKINRQYAYEKIGLNEVEGLKQVLTDLVKPIQTHLKENIYWNDCEFHEAEYKSRDGFIVHTHNCGGLELVVVIPKVEEYDFSFLEFGECDTCGTPECVNDSGEPIQCGYQGQECASESDGHLDAIIRVWFKFEGIDDKGFMKFYLYAGGGNNDAPYFRSGKESTIFESEFKAKSMTELYRKGKVQVNKLIRKIS